MTINRKTFVVICALAAYCSAPSVAMAQIGGSIGVGGIGIDVSIGGGAGGGGAGPSGAPLPLLGGTLLGHAALVGAGFMGWRRRNRKSA